MPGQLALILDRISTWILSSSASFIIMLEILVQPNPFLVHSRDYDLDGRVSIMELVPVSTWSRADTKIYGPIQRVVRPNREPVGFAGVLRGVHYSLAFARVKNAKYGWMHARVAHVEMYCGLHGNMNQAKLAIEKLAGIMPLRRNIDREAVRQFLSQYIINPGDVSEFIP